MSEPIDRIYPPLTDEMRKGKKEVFYCFNCKRKMPFRDFVRTRHFLPAFCPLCGKLSVISNLTEKIFKVKVEK